MDAIPVYVVYDHPKDYPDHIVVRRQWVWAWFWLGTERRTPAIGHDVEVHRMPSLGVAHAWLRSLGLHRLERQDEDDPVIVETWI